MQLLFLNKTFLFLFQVFFVFACFMSSVSCLVVGLPCFQNTFSNSFKNFIVAEHNIHQQYILCIVAVHNTHQQYILCIVAVHNTHQQYIFCIVAEHSTHQQYMLCIVAIVE